MKARKVAGTGPAARIMAAKARNADDDQQRAPDLVFLDRRSFGKHATNGHHGAECRKYQ